MSEYIEEINVGRIKYLMQLFGLQEEAFLKEISKKLKTTLARKDIFSTSIKLSNLKRIDKLFKRGLSFYTDPSPLKVSPNSSIFFRKNNFNSPLEISDRARVTEIETRIDYLSALANLSGHKNWAEPYRTLYKYKEDSPEKAAHLLRENLYPQGKNNKISTRDFLKALIEKFAEKNIMVHEFVEAPRLTCKSNFDGFFINPNHIAIKRNQKAFKREVFTLAHELGHYLLGNEELDKIRFGPDGLKTIERWCNDFAFHFLMGEDQVSKLDKIGSTNNIDYQDKAIKEISTKNHVSRLALFTHLAKQETISWKQYENIKSDIDNEYKVLQEKEKLKKRKDKEEGKKSVGRTAKPIQSPLEKELYVSAYFEGVVNEYEVLKRCAASNKNKTIEEIIYE